MNTLLIKDLSRVEELDRNAARAVHGGMQTIKAPDDPMSCLKLPTMPTMPTMPPPPSIAMPPMPTGGGCGGPVIHPLAQPAQDPRLV